MYFVLLLSCKGHLSRDEDNSSTRRIFQPHSSDSQVKLCKTIPQFVQESLQGRKCNFNGRDYDVWDTGGGTFMAPIIPAAIEA